MPGYLSIRFYFFMTNIQLNATIRPLPTPELQIGRKEKRIPAVVYGAGKDQLMVLVNQIEAIKVLRDAGESTVVDLVIEGGETVNVLIHDVQLDPVSDTPIHFDFLRVDMKKLIRAHIHINFIGEAPAIKAGHIVLNQIEGIEVESLPGALVSHLDVDTSNLVNVGDEILVSQLTVPEGIKVLTDPDQVVIAVLAHRAEKVEAQAVAEEVKEEKTEEKPATE